MNLTSLRKILRYNKKVDDIALVTYCAYKILIVLRKYGYWRSLKIGKPVDSKGNCIPWYTYPAIEYLKQFNYKDKRIFEWGSGHSSIFWGKRAKEVISVEDNYNWYKEIKKRKPRNLEVVYCKRKVDYINLIKTRGGKYDVIVIDGEYRRECAAIAPRYLKRGGFIILENSDWYQDITGTFRKLGFFEIDFSGFGAINVFTWSTSIFHHNVFNFKSLNDKMPSKPIGS